MGIRKNLSSIGLWVLVLMMFACSSDKGDNPLSGENNSEQVTVSVGVFNNVRVVAFEYEEQRKPDVTYLDAGRLIMKKVDLPEFDEPVKVMAKVRLRSGGDMYDRVGVAFLAKSPVTFNEIEKELALVGQWDCPGAGVEASEDGAYQPVLDLLHFSTPFGVGYYSNKVAVEGGISRWENDVVWEREVTELESELQGEVWLGVWIDTWSSENYQDNGFLVDFSLNYTKNGEAESLKDGWVKPLFNTSKFSAKQKYYELFAHSDLEVSFSVPEGVKNVKLYYQTTGHGPNNGDEFNPRPHTLSLDGSEILQFTPWRNDCRSFRKYNPTSHKNVDGKGTWSSDLDRSNWCPGSMVDPQVVELNNLAAGDHTLTVHVEGALEGDNNFWSTCAYLVGEKTE